ncbi:MAG: GRP family sugar transporter [Acidobacteria bacterium]|nr:GRP family sugar transporter [Acidobacteriota bacterium]
MLLPTTYGTALLLAILSMICWGSWANTLKLSGKWRFELFYYDYSFGVLITALVAALTAGSWGDLNLFDYMDLTMKFRLGLALLAGVIFNLANILLVAAIAVAGLAVAFPVGIGLTLVIGVIWNYLLVKQGNPMLLFGGAALVVVAIVFDALAHARRAREEAASNKKRKSATKGIVLSVIAGVLMGTFYPLVVKSMSEPLGAQPYLAGLMFAIGIFFSTLVFNLIFMNLPVEGKPLGLVDYLRGTRKQHLLGVLGGSIWCLGTVLNFVIGHPGSEAKLGPAVSYALGQGATMVSAFWGVAVWKEFAGASAGLKRLLFMMFALFLAGLVLVSMAPLY